MPPTTAILRRNMKRSIALLMLLALSTANAVSLQCKLGTTRCIKSQGTEMPAKQAIEISEYCDEFTYNDLGRIALRLSQKEILDRSGGKITPLMKAWYAFDYLYDSPLRFERKKKAEETNCFEIKHSCQQLDRDFNDDSKWTS